MVEKIQKGWRIISWRSACLLSALLLHAWGFSSPLTNTEKSAAAHQPQNSAVSLSFIAPSIERSADSPTLEAVIKKVKKIEPRTQKKAAPPLAKAKPSKAKKTQVDQQQKLISSNTQHKGVIAEHSRDKKPQQDTAKEETLAAAASTTSQSTNSGVHDNPIINEPLFDRPPTPPKYPTVARKRGQQGTVWLEIWLDKWGKQSRLKVMQSSGINVLDKAALQAVADWHFQPHRINGQSIASRVQIPVEFALN